MIYKHAMTIGQVAQELVAVAYWMGSSYLEILSTKCSSKSPVPASFLNCVYTQLNLTNLIVALKLKN